jgi:hypothetical protein
MHISSKLCILHVRPHLSLLALIMELVCMLKSKVKTMLFDLCQKLFITNLFIQNTANQHFVLKFRNIYFHYIYLNISNLGKSIKYQILAKERLLPTLDHPEYSSHVSVYHFYILKFKNFLVGISFLIISRSAFGK